MTTKEKRYYDTHHEEILRKKREYREKNREKIRQQDRERYKNNPQKFRDKANNYYNDNPEKIQKYREDNKEKILQQHRNYNERHKEERKQWYEENKERILKRNQEYRKNNPEMMKKHNKNFVIRTRDKLFEILGGKICTGCGETDDACLQFDHKNGGGLNDIKKHGSSREMYRYYIDNPDLAKETLQVLCSNCNWKKKKKNNENSYQNKLPPIN